MSQRKLHVAVIIMSFGAIRDDVQRRPNQLIGSLKISSSGMEEAEQMQRVEMPVIAGKHLEIELLRFRELAGPMRTDRARKHRFNRSSRLARRSVGHVGGAKGLVVRF